MNYYAIQDLVIGFLICLFFTLVFFATYYAKRKGLLRKILIIGSTVCILWYLNPAINYVKYVYAAWSGKTQIATTLSVAGTELFSSAVTVNPGAVFRIHVKGNSGGTTDNLVITLYSTLDASTEEWTTVGDYSFVLDCTSGNDEIVQFVVSGIYRFRIGFVRDGSTDTITTNAWYREDGVSL